MNSSINPMNIGQKMQMNIDPMKMNMMMLQFQMMNSMNKNNPCNLNQFYNTPSMGNFFNSEYYKIKNSDPLNDNNLTRTEKNLSLFFNCIYNFNKNINYNGTKIYINYYNLEKIELFLDLRLQVKDLISIIFGLILSNSNEKKYCKRMEKNQTTQMIIDNPTFFYESDLPYKNIMYLEFNNINLKKLSKKTGFEIGLKEGDEIFLKLKKECYNELKILNLDYNTIVFKDENGIIITFPSFQEEIISDMCKRFTKFIDIDDNSCFFIFDGNDLKKNSKKIKELLLPSSIIEFKHPSLKGGFEFKFTDVSKEKVTYLKFSKTAPIYRTIKEGLNIFGICQNKECIANQKEVVYIPENMDIEDNYFKFNVIEQIKNMICPICQRIIKSKTLGFYKCEYQIIGEKIEEGILKQYDSKPKETKDDKFEYFDSDENGEITWTSLVIYVLPKQKIKYQSNQ